MSGGALAGTTVTNDDLGWGDPDVPPGGAATFRLGRHSFRFEGFGVDVEGDGPLSRTIDFDGQCYSIGSQVSSEASATFFGADYGFDLVHNDLMGLGLTLGARFVSTEAKLTAVSLGIHGLGEVDALMPAIGVKLVMHPLPVPLLASLALVGRLVGGYLPDIGQFVDAEEGVEWLPIPVLALRAGYRYFHASGEDGNNEAQITLSGPYVSVTLAF